MLELIGSEIKDTAKRARGGRAQHHPRPGVEPGRLALLWCKIKSNYFYNRLCQNYPRRFVPILRRNGATQTKTSFVCFVAHIKIEDHMFLVF